MNTLWTWTTIMDNSTLSVQNKSSGKIYFWLSNFIDFINEDDSILFDFLNNHFLNINLRNYKNENSPFYTSFSILSRIISLKLSLISLTFIVCFSNAVPDWASDNYTKHSQKMLLKFLRYSNKLSRDSNFFWSTRSGGISTVTNLSSKNP